MANVPAGAWSTDLSSPTAAVKSQRSPGELQRATESRTLVPRFKSGCQTCGIVESISKLDATGSTPAVYAFTVRLRDGSARVTNDATVGNWRVGDSIMLIGGDRPSSITPVSL